MRQLLLLPFLLALTACMTPISGNGEATDEPIAVEEVGNARQEPEAPEPKTEEKKENAPEDRPGP